MFERERGTTGRDRGPFDSRDAIERTRRRLRSDREPTGAPGSGLTRDGSAGIGGVSSTLARFDQPRGPGTTFAVVADAHLSAPDGTSRRGTRPRGRLAAAVTDAGRLDVDAILVAGDLTASGTTVEVALAEQVLSDAVPPVIALPGDRDVSAGDGSVRDGSHRVEPETAGWIERDECPAAHRVGGVVVLAVDTTTGDGTVPTSTRGGSITREERCWLTRTARADPDPTIFLTHHAIAPLPDPLGDHLDDREYRVREPARTADVLADAGVELAVSGHLQWPTAARYRDVNTVGAPSTTSFPPAYLLVDVEPRGTTVSLVPLASWPGIERDYRRACAGAERGAAISDAVGAGYFQELPRVDRRTREPNGTASAATEPRRT